MNSTLITKIKGLAVTVLLLGSQVAFGQSVPTKTENHMLKREARTATQTPQDFEGLFDRSDVVETVEYFDGLGRPAQTVQWEASPDGHDIITTHSYNALGQQDRQYLPYSSRHNLGKCQDANKISYERTSFFSAANTELSHWPAVDLAAPFGETVFEASPLGRVEEQSAPGAAWQVLRDAFGNSTGQGHTLRASWRPNLLSDSIIFFPNGTGAGFQVTKYWPAGELWVTISLDENGSIKQKFTDKQGRLIAEKAQIDNQTFTYTYYLYAANSHDLAIVIQPQGVRELVIAPNNGQLSQNLLDKQSFQYRYDARHRVIEKRVPGRDWTYIVYNNINQPILTQDGNQAANNEWYFTKYDAIGRPILTGIWTDNLGRNRAVIQQLMQQETMLWEKASNQHVAFLKGYTNNAFPDITANCELLAVSYFDSYDFNRNGQTDPNEGFVNDPRIGGINELSMLVKGKVTAVNQRVMGTNDWLLTVTFYDALGRELQTVSENSLGGEDRITFSYNFNGTVARSCHRHTTSVETIEVYKEFTYDHRDRLIEIAQDLHKGGGNWTPQPIILAKNEYNELGELVSKGLHSQNQGMSFLQNVDFKYNIRGWLSKINEIETCGKVNGGSGISGGSHTVDAINLGKFTANVSSMGTGELKIAYGDQKTVDLTSHQNGANLTAQGDLHREAFLAASLPSTNTVQLNVPMNNLKVLKDNYQIAESTLRQAASSQLRTSGLSSSDQAEVVNTLAAGMVWELDDIFKPNEDLFAMELKYTQQIGLNSAASSQYNGNIAAMKWQTPGSCEAKTYAFQYDKQNRLLNAWFAMENVNGWINQDRYSTSYDYDLNGNLRQLNREGMIGANQFGRMDEMVYSYDGNQLLSIADAGPDNLPTGVTHFIDNIMDQAIEYQYDANGNMIEDDNKGLTASYNLLNKPTEVDMGNGRKIRFFYLSDGTKIRKEVDNNGTITTTHYLGGFQYEDAGNGPSLQHFAHEEGRVVFNAAGPQYFDIQYRLADHLGNTRILFREDPADPGETEVLQEQAYYPFGMMMAEGNLPVSSPPDHYGYNGKEMQMEFGLGWLDYGFRFYAPDMGRFFSVDPLAEDFKHLTTYQYASNSPVWMIDIDGLEGIPPGEVEPEDVTRGAVSGIAEANRLQGPLKEGKASPACNIAVREAVRTATGSSSLFPQNQGGQVLGNGLANTIGTSLANGVIDDFAPVADDDYATMQEEVNEGAVIIGVYNSAVAGGGGHIIMIVPGNTEENVNFEGGVVPQILEAGRNHRGAATVLNDNMSPNTASQMNWFIYIGPPQENNEDDPQNDRSSNDN
jgi:RHS repeat-associated protein